MEEKRPISDKAILEAFGETGDFVARDVDAAGFRLRAYFIDGLTSGGDISDFVIKPLSTVLSGQTPSELLEKARTGSVYNCVVDPVEDLDAALLKLVNGFCLVVFPGESTALAF